MPDDERGASRLPALAFFASLLGFGALVAYHRHGASAAVRDNRNDVLRDDVHPDRLIARSVLPSKQNHRREPGARARG